MSKWQGQKGRRKCHICLEKRGHVTDCHYCGHNTCWQTYCHKLDDQGNKVCLRCQVDSKHRKFKEVQYA